MNWLIEWQAISARIQGLLDAGAFFYKALHHSSADDQSVKKEVLLPSAEKILRNLKEFSEKFSSALPHAALQSLNSFTSNQKMNKSDFFNPSTQYERANVQYALTSLASFRSEFDFLIADTQFIARKITERAFIHLQRCIVADSEMRKKWRKAYDEHETECEKLGATHLLQHGVWAFKANAEGARTDLILCEPKSPAFSVENIAEAIVLTEWKIVKSQDQLLDKATEALTQAELYSSGVLGGIEIANYRFLVMVTEKGMKMPDDQIEGNVTYRHINIAVNPDTPSVEARTG